MSGQVCAVIPAAGRGSRLGAALPKILLKLNDQETIWSLFKKKLTMVDHIHVIVSPQGEPFIRSALADDIASGLVSLSIQLEPLGMGDAIFTGYPIWSQAETLLIVWGDQVFLSTATCERALSAHAGAEKTVALPLTVADEPYVEYCFDGNQRLLAVKQTREGELCTKGGWGDVGVFVTSVNGLLSHWEDYLQTMRPGAQTKEINFLPFLPFLAAHGWDIKPLTVENSLEARGVNTPEDWLFFQKVYAGLSL